MGFWSPQVDSDNRISFSSFRLKSWKCAICTSFELSNTVSILNHKTELIKLARFTFSLVRIFHFLKIYFRNKINWAHRVLDYTCNIPFAVRICLYNYTDFSGITSDLQRSSCLLLATDHTDWVCCIVSCICKAPIRELVQEKKVLISSHLCGGKEVLVNILVYVGYTFHVALQIYFLMD